jgi:hypothetical protein
MQQLDSALGAVIPGADPAAALAIIEERTAAARAPRPQTGAGGGASTATALPVERLKSDFLAATAGYWVVAFANQKFTTQYNAPAVLLIKFFAAKASADAMVQELMRDPAVKFAPSVVPANTPCLIPYSEAAAVSAAHVLPKLERAGKRIAEYHQYRKDEFAHYVKTKQPGERAASDYQRAKMRLLRERARALRGDATTPGTTTLTPEECARIDSILTAPLPRHDFENLKPGCFQDGGSGAGAGAGAGVGAGIEVLRTSEGVVAQYDPSCVGGTMESAGEQVLQRLREARAGGAGLNAGTGAGAGPRALADAGACTPSTDAAPTQMEFGSRPAAAAGAASTTGPVAASGAPAAPIAPRPALVVAPPPILADSAAVPAHWQVRGGALQQQIDDAWPGRWTDAARFAIISVTDDYDLPQDDPAFADAAGNEPLLIVWGGEYDDEADAKRALEERIAPWCEDLVLDVVAKHRLLVPSAVDPDKIEEKGRTERSEFSAQLNKILKHNKDERRAVEEVRARRPDIPTILAGAAAAAATGAGTGAGAAAPPRPLPAISLLGAVQQFDADGNILNAEEVEQSAFASGLPDLFEKK